MNEPVDDEVVDLALDDETVSKVVGGAILVGNFDGTQSAMPLIATLPPGPKPRCANVFVRDGKWVCP